MSVLRPALLLAALLVSSATAFIRPVGLSNAGLSTASAQWGVSSGRVAARGRSTVMGAVRQVTGEELEKELSEWGTPIVLDVFAQWCGPCQILAGELERVAGLYGDKLRLLKVDSDLEPRIASALKVYGLPTIFLMKEGQLVYRVEGALPASDLTKLINEHLFGAAPSGGSSSS